MLIVNDIFDCHVIWCDANAKMNTSRGPNSSMVKLLDVGGVLFFVKYTKTENV